MAKTVVMNTVVGVKESSFTTKDSGEKVSGVNIYYTYEDEKTEGVACDRVFATKAKLDGWEPTPGELFEIVYNKFGRVDCFVVDL